MSARSVLKFLPAPFWCYFLPMAAGSLGWIPRESSFYTFASAQILPICLALLLIGTDLAALARMGWPAFRLMIAGSAGTLLGAMGAYALCRQGLPPGAWGAVGALAGSWIGGSANMLAVKEALGVPDPLIGPVILVDALVAYSWMALLIAASAWQSPWNRHIGQGACRAGSGPLPCSDKTQPLHGTKPGGSGRVKLRAASGPSPSRHPWPILGSVGLICLALIFSIALSLLAQAIARRLPLLPGITASTWTILLVTTAALMLSATPLRQIGGGRNARLGTWLLYLLLITIGARANLQAAWNAPLFLGMGLIWIAIHGAVLLTAGLFWKAPLGLIATASQANIGGVVSAPIVGAAYSAELAGVGLLMAVFGNLLGTYLGMLAAFAVKSLFS